MKHSSYIYIAIIALFISSFPLALGWLPLGAYVPRFIFLVLSLSIFPFVLGTRQFVFLCLYYVYIVLANFAVGKPVEFSGISANFMEMAIPIIAMTILVKVNSTKDFKLMGLFSLTMTFATILTSLYVLTYIDPTAIRALIGIMANGEPITPYLRMGVADYSTAAMVMAMPCVLIGLYKNSHNRRSRLLCVLGMLLSLWFMYKASVTTTFFICLITTFGTLFINERRSIKGNVAITFSIVFLMILFVFPLVLSFFSSVLNDEISSRSAMMNELWTGSSYDDSEDLGTRLGLYQLSIRAFISNPIFGNASAVVGGHNYILDRLGLYGLIGTILHFTFVIYQCKLSYKVVPDKFKIYYSIVLLSVFVLAFLKNLSGFDYWTFMFLYYPCILVWGEKSVHSNITSRSSR